jgi:hypothetical protein
MIFERGVGNAVGLDSVVGTGWTMLGSNPSGGEIFRVRPDQPWGPPSLLYNGTGFLGRGVAWR